MVVGAVFGPVERTIAIKGTSEVECEVMGLPSGVSIVSALPWSARMKRPTPLAAQASLILPTHMSVCAVASIALSMKPVWPTMSGGARLQMSRWCVPSLISRTWQHTAPRRQRGVGTAGGGGLGAV